MEDKGRLENGASWQQILCEGILRGGFQNFNPLCGRNPIETDLE